MKKNLLQGTAAFACVAIVIAGVVLNEGRAEHHPDARPADLNILLDSARKIAANWNPADLEHQFSPYGVGTAQDHAKECSYLAQHVGNVKAIEPLKGTEMTPTAFGTAAQARHVSGHVLVVGDKGTAILSFVMGYDGHDWLIEAFGVSRKPSRTPMARKPNAGGSPRPVYASPALTVSETVS